MLIKAFLTNESEFERKIIIFIQLDVVAVMTWNAMFGNKTLL